MERKNPKRKERRERRERKERRLRQRRILPVEKMGRRTSRLNQLNQLKERMEKMKADQQNYNFIQCLLFSFKIYLILDLFLELIYMLAADIREQILKVKF